MISRTYDFGTTFAYLFGVGGDCATTVLEATMRYGPRLKSGNGLDHTSPFAERELTLSEIDSKYQNGEIDRDRAEKMMVALDNPVMVLAYVTGTDK